MSFPVLPCPSVQVQSKHHPNLPNIPKTKLANSKENF